MEEKRVRKKILGVNFRQIINFFTVLFFLVVIAITTSLVQQQDLRVLASKSGRNCKVVPAGSYDVKVKIFTSMPWKVICGKRKWSGKIPAYAEIPFGYRWVPKISKGASYAVNTTLKDICTPKFTGWNNICQVCKFVDCSKIKINGNLKAKKIMCPLEPLEAYQVKGQGQLKFSYQGGLSCSAKATYKGKLRGSFIGHIPVCGAVGSRSEGWYWQDTAGLIKYSWCKGCYAVCKAVGTRSEGWYSSCDNSLIIYDWCGRKS